MYNILVCDDDKEIVKAIEIYLSKEGYNVLKAYDGNECLKVINNNTIHLVILDIMMPKKDGIETLNEIRKNSSIPVIMLSAKSEDEDKINGLNLGADDYVTKPFKTRELISRIKNILRRNNNYDVINIKNITIDLKQAKVFKNGVDVNLTALEYKILLALALNPNQVFTRERLLADIWDVNEEYVYDNTLTVYIKRIREKIEDDITDPKIIKTVRGIGYKIGDGND